MHFSPRLGLILVCKTGDNLTKVRIISFSIHCGNSMMMWVHLFYSIYISTVQKVMPKSYPAQVVSKNPPMWS